MPTKIPEFRMVAQNYVLRSVYLDPEFDNFLREQAFRLNISKNDLIRDYLERGARQQLGEAIKATSSGSSKAHFTSSVIRAAVGAKLLHHVGSKVANKASFELSPLSSGASEVDTSPSSAVTKVSVKSSGLGQVKSLLRKPTKKAAKKAAKKATKKASKK